MFNFLLQVSVKKEPDASQSPSSGSSSMNVMQMINAIKSQSSSSAPSRYVGIRMADSILFY